MTNRNIPLPLAKFGDSSLHAHDTDKDRPRIDRRADTNVAAQQASPNAGEIRLRRPAVGARVALITVLTVLIAVALGFGKFLGPATDGSSAENAAYDADAGMASSPDATPSGRRAGAANHDADEPQPVSDNRREGGEVEADSSALTEDDDTHSPAAGSLGAPRAVADSSPRPASNPEPANADDGETKDEVDTSEEVARATAAYVRERRHARMRKRGRSGGNK